MAREGDRARQVGLARLWDASLDAPMDFGGSRLTNRPFLGPTVPQVCPLTRLEMI